MNSPLWTCWSVPHTPISFRQIAPDQRPMLLLAACFDYGPKYEKEIFSYSKEITFQQHLVVVNLGNRYLANLEVTRLVDEM